MKMNRALINYVSHLEREEGELWDKLDAMSSILEEGVNFCFPFFDIESKEQLQELAEYIREEKLENIKDIAEYITFLKTGCEEAEEALKNCLERDGTTKEEFIEECEFDYDSIINDYAELIELIEYMMK